MPITGREGSELPLGRRSDSLPARTALAPTASDAVAADKLDRATFFATMGAFPTGVTIVTTLDGQGEPKGLTSNAICSVSADPCLLLVCVDQASNTLPGLRFSRRFVVNYLGPGAAALATLFASKEPDKFRGVEWKPALNGMPLLHRDSIAHAECTTVDEIVAGDHIILLARVDSGQPPRSEDLPLMYFRRQFATWPG
jgi:flavin reductase (DIM6/NTAB) family NADH-FMN oxidoreductase RutF